MRRKKANLYLFLAIGFFIITIGNFYMGGLNDEPRILLNIGWLIIAGLYFFQYLKFRKAD